MQYIVNFSAGLTSWKALQRTIERHGVAHTTAVFADVKIEDADAYRFLRDTEQHFGIEITTVADGRTPFEVWRDVKTIVINGVAPCSKILKRETVDRWVAEQFGDAPVTRVFGMDWSEVGRMVRLRAALAPVPVWFPLAEAPYVDKCHISDELGKLGIAVPALYLEGFSHNNCFAGTERFVTSDGAESFESMAGQEVTVMTKGGAWAKAKIECFGEQPLVALHLQRGSESKTIHTTAEHRWLTYHGNRSNNRVDRLTNELTPGTRLVSLYGRPSDNIRPSPFGIAHGIVYGDGTKPLAYPNAPATVTLCGDKDLELLKYFPLSATRKVPGIGILVADLPRFFKDAPDLSESRSYLYGWLAGYFAADGKVSRDGSVILASARYENLRIVRDVCYRLGIGTKGIQTEMRQGYAAERVPLYTLRFVRQTLTPNFFLIATHRERAEQFGFEYKQATNTWIVESVEPTDRVELVYCAVVPDTHCFLLEDNILTGNCGGGCVKAGQAHWAHLWRMRPETYARWEREEAEFIAWYGKKITILKDRAGGGPRRPITLAAFRQRLERGEAYDTDDWGGCGCFSQTPQLRMDDLLLEADVR